MQCMEAVFIGLEAALEAPNTHIVDALLHLEILLGPNPNHNGKELQSVMELVKWE